MILRYFSFFFLYVSFQGSLCLWITSLSIFVNLHSDFAAILFRLCFDDENHICWCESTSSLNDDKCWGDFNCLEKSPRSVFRRERMEPLNRFGLEPEVCPCSVISLGFVFYLPESCKGFRGEHHTHQRNINICSWCNSNSYPYMAFVSKVGTTYSS